MKARHLQSSSPGGATEVCHHGGLFRPFGAPAICLISVVDPGLTPWATVFRPFGAFQVFHPVVTRGLRPGLHAPRAHALGYFLSPLRGLQGSLNNRTNI